MAMKHLSMFGCTLIVERVLRGDRHLRLNLRRAGTGSIWTLEIPEDDQVLDKLTQPGACFALVELASVAQAESRGRL